MDIPKNPHSPGWPGWRSSFPGVIKGARSFRSRCPRCCGFHAFSESNGTASKGWKGIQTTVNHTCKTKTLGVVFLETSHTFLSISSNMQIAQMTKNWESKCLQTETKDVASLQQFPQLSPLSPLEGS